MQRTQHIAVLRRIVARLESAFPDATTVPLPFGLPEIDRHFPGSGLTGGALHEVMAASYGDRPAAFGFAIALMVHALAAHRGPAVLIAARRCLADFGQPYGHGLRQLGLDVDRLVLVEARLDKDALWAMEEALILLRPPITAGTSAAATRWRIAAAPAGRDRFGAFAFCRWSAALERCRNGRPGHWLLEWNHVAHRFGLAELLADRAPAAGAGQDSRRLAG
jgi:protein ImuA